VAVATNFTTKYATQLLPGGLEVVLLAQCLVMACAVQLAGLMGWVELTPLSVKRWVREVQLFRLLPDRGCGGAAQQERGSTVLVGGSHNKRKTKDDKIVDVFLREEGHCTSVS
jgi:hypothetical protein